MREYNFLAWLYKKLIYSEVVALKDVIKNKIGNCPKIPHKKTRCNNEKFYMYKRERNESNYYYDIFGLDIDYAKKHYVPKAKKENKKEDKILNEITKKELIKDKTLSQAMAEILKYNNLKKV